MIWLHDGIVEAISPDLDRKMKRGQDILSEALKDENVTPPDTHSKHKLSIEKLEHSTFTHEDLANYCSGAIDTALLRRASATSSALVDALREAHQRKLIESGHANEAIRNFGAANEYFSLSYIYAQEIETTLSKYRARVAAANTPAAINPVQGGRRNP